MSIQLSTAVRNARVDAIESVIDVSPKLQVRTGPQPANCAAADAGTLLVEMTCPANWLSDATNGTKTLIGAWTGTAVAVGIAAHFRLKDSIGTTHIQGTITGIGGNGDLILDNPSIVTTQTVNLLSFTLTDANL